MGEQQCVLGAAQRPRLQSNRLPSAVVTSGLNVTLSTTYLSSRGKCKTELRPACNCSVVRPCHGHPNLCGLPLSGPSGTCGQFAGSVSPRGYIFCSYCHNCNGQSDSVKDLYRVPCHLSIYKSAFYCSASHDQLLSQLCKNTFILET